MHIIKTGKEHVVFMETNKPVQNFPINSKNKLFEQDVLLENNSQAKLLILEKDNPSVLISKNISSMTPPSVRVFQRTDKGDFTIGQEIFVAIFQGEPENADFFTCLITDIIPNGYLR